jgi:hypothetical protein
MGFYQMILDFYRHIPMTFLDAVDDLSIIYEIQIFVLDRSLHIDH